jgi:hypothetical protein
MMVGICMRLKKKEKEKSQIGRATRIDLKNYRNDPATSGRMVPQGPHYKTQKKLRSKFVFLAF